MQGVSTPNCCVVPETAVFAGCFFFPLFLPPLLLAAQGRGQDAEAAWARQAAVPGQGRVFKAPHPPQSWAPGP